MSTNTTRLNIEFADWLVCGIALAVGSLTLIKGDTAMMVGVIGVPFAIIWIARALLDRKQRSWRLRALTYTSAILLLIAGPTSCAFHVARTEAAMQSVIEALDQHRARTGNFPKELSELSPSPEVTCPSSWNRQANYSATSGGKQFHLTCVTFGMNKHTYESETGLWRDWD